MFTQDERGNCNVGAIKQDLQVCRGESSLVWCYMLIIFLGLVLSGPLRQLLPGHEGEHPRAGEVLVQVCLHHRVENLVFMY